MKPHKFFTIGICLIFLVCTSSAPVPKSIDFKFLQLNLWVECTKAPDAGESLLKQLYYIDPDIATFCELYKEDSLSVLARLIPKLKELGRNYYVARVDGRAVISKYPVISKQRINRWACKVVLNVRGRRVAVYPSHSEYRYYSCYGPRGYGDGTESWEKLDSPIRDTAALTQVCRMSGRIESASQVIEDAEMERMSDAVVIYAGDFNEPSHLDWTKSTSHMFGHNGCEVRWPLSYYIVEKKGFVDAYREIHPNPLKYPGITFPSACPPLSPEQIAWAKEADERDRIDMIYYYPDDSLMLKDCCLAGPKETIAYCKTVRTPGKDKYIFDKTAFWPSDHKGVLATFTLRIN